MLPSADSAAEYHHVFNERIRKGFTGDYMSLASSLLSSSSSSLPSSLMSTSVISGCYYAKVKPFPNIRHPNLLTLTKCSGPLVPNLPGGEHARGAHGGHSGQLEAPQDQSDQHLRAAERCIQ